MIPILWILGGAVLAAGVVGLVATFWNDILDFLRRAVQKVKAVVQGVLHGSKIFLKKMREAVQEISRHYSKVGNRWQETIVTRTVSESEIPEEILQKARLNQEYDITDELEMQLEVG